MGEIVILRLQDPNEREVYEVYVVEVFASEMQMQNEVTEIINEFYKSGFEDWSYDDLIDELEKRGLLKVITTEEFVIYA